MTVRERLWLLLPDDIDLPLAARASMRLIRRRLSRAMAQRESALLEGIRAEGLELVGDGGRRELTICLLGLLTRRAIS